MLITKTNPVGLDWHIQKVQERLYEELLKKWGAVTYHCYGRAHRNRTTDGYTAEIYTGGDRYKEVYWDSAADAVSFFGLHGTEKKDAANTIGVHLVFFVNLAKLKPGIAHRADEEIRQDVFNVVGGHSYGLSFHSIELWVENVLKEYPGSRREERLKYVDMHPVHCFRINYNLTFNPNKQDLKFK